MLILRPGLALLVGAVLMVAGCVSTAGPFVTNISSDGQGGLVVEKAMVEYNQWTERITTKNHTTIYIPAKAHIEYPAAQPPKVLGESSH